MPTTTTMKIMLSMSQTNNDTNNDNELSNNNYKNKKHNSTYRCCIECKCRDFFVDLQEMDKQLLN